MKQSLPIVIFKICIKFQLHFILRNIPCKIEFARLREWKKFIRKCHRQHWVKTRHAFVKHGCPRRQQSQIWQKSLSPTF